MYLFQQVLKNLTPDVVPCGADWQDLEALDKIAAVIKVRSYVEVLLGFMTPLKQEADALNENLMETTTDTVDAGATHTGPHVNFRQVTPAMTV